MTVLDRIKSLFRRAKPGAKAAEEKAAEVTEGSLLRPPSPRKRHPKPLGGSLKGLASGKGPVRAVKDYESKARTSVAVVAGTSRVCTFFKVGKSGAQYYFNAEREKVSPRSKRWCDST